ncbi:alkaline phosphatase D family protein [Microlunatus sp. Y2014]|uniref:alkaline phosphatase D family protein n=1 Tax=Microlunatus sp. Y2014 TaxID=3418488 RepID=UPI003DA76270
MPVHRPETSAHSETDAETRAAVRANRRQFLTGAGVAFAAGLGANLPSRAHAAPGGPAGGDHPFTLGIASGDPLPDAVVIWTRLAPSPYEPDGGMGRRMRPVQWQVATDESFRQVVRSGVAHAHPEFAHTVHVDVRGLQPNREYHYRFRSGKHLSEVGRTRTAPAPGQHVTGLDIVSASCQSLGAGFYHAWADANQDPADLVLFLGDYIYEYAVAPSSVRWPYQPALPSGYERGTDTLERYRQQYALYKTDPDLMEAHRLSPWLITWDDHEVVNDYDSTDEDLFVRRANAYRAFWEHQPLRLAQRPSGKDAQLYRRLTWGDLAEFSMLDVRQYRTPELASDVIPTDPRWRDPSRSMLGPSQEQWLLDGLSASDTRWNVMAQGVLFGRLDTDPSAEINYSRGGWDGYQISQERIIEHVTDAEVENFVVLTGDVHRNYDLDILADYDDPDSSIVGVELACSSISSGGNGVDSNQGVLDRYAANAHLKFANLQRGYVRSTVDHTGWEAEVRVLDRVDDPDTFTASTRITLRSEAGEPGLNEI